MKRKIFAILNLFSVIILIAWNGYANSGNFNGKSVGDLSAEYNNLFTPASYAFSIWGLIFLMLLVYGVYGIYQAFSSSGLGKVQELANATATSYARTTEGYDDKIDFVNATAPWFLLANLFCTVWVVFWLEEMVAVSVLCMLGILFCLIMCLIKLKMEVWDAPFPIIAFVWWPLCLYAGWISVATIANFSAWLNYSYEFSTSFQVTATLVMIAVAVLLNIAMVVFKNMREFALVAVWALVAIYMRHVDALPSLAYTALGGAVIVFIVVGIHGARNTETNPFKKLQEWRQ